MKKFLLFVLVVGAVLFIPQLRARAWVMAQPVLVYVQPAVDMVLAPIRRYRAKTEAMAIARQLSENRRTGRPLPSPRTFEAWVRKHVTSVPEAYDPWGSPYYLERNGSTLQVGSNGGDQKRGTADDIVRKVMY